MTDKGLAIELSDPPGADLGQDVMVRLETGEVVTLLEFKDRRKIITRGGEGSGHFAHEGRPGEVGGSLPSGEIAVADIEEDYEWKPIEGEYALATDIDELVKITKEVDDEQVDIEIVSGPERGGYYDGYFIDDLEEPEYDLLDLWTAEDIDSTVSRAREIFGLTGDFSEAGYILDDGDMLDFSGKYEGGTPGMRSRDHREIGQAFEGDTPPYTEGMVWFMDKANAIRISYHTDDLMVDFAGPPTRAQRELIETIGMQSERVFWDVDRWYDADPEEGTEGRFITIESGETSNDLEEIEEMLENVRGIYYSPDYEEKSWVIKTLNQIITILRGGEGSGHRGHEGRPGEVGGSLPSGRTAGKPTSYSDYVEIYDARPREGEIKQEYTYRIYDNAVKKAFAELEGLTPDEILSIDKYDFNLYDLKESGIELHIDPDAELTDPAFEGLTDEQKQMLRTSYMYGVQSGYDKVLEFTHRRLVATGMVSPDDPRLDYSARRTQGSGEWEQMPETLYHVTTAAEAVKADKLRSRFELGLDKTKGLGGGEDDTVSFTADFEIARDIDRGLHEASAVARGDFTVEDMVRWSIEGKDAPKPYLGFLYALQSGYASISDEEIAEIDRRVAADPTDIPDNVKKAMDHNIEKGADDLDMAWRFYSAYWANARQHEGGPTYPLFWGAEREALASSDPSQFTILEFTPTEGSLGYQMGGLGEWRSVGGDTVRIVGEHETLTADEEEEYFGR